MMFRLRMLLGDPRHRIGRSGERRAARWLRARGYQIVRRRLKLGWDEADIIAIDREGVLVIVEVKASSNRDVQPELLVGGRKQHRMSRLAGKLLRQRIYAGRACRFDVIAVNLAEQGDDAIRHYPNAFESRY